MIALEISLLHWLYYKFKYSYSNQLDSLFITLVYFFRLYTRRLIKWIILFLNYTLVENRNKIN